MMLMMEMIMLLHMPRGRNPFVFFPTQTEAIQKGFHDPEPLNVRTDKEGLAADLNQIVNDAMENVLARTKAAQPNTPSACTDQQRLEAALARPLNLSQRDIESGEDLMRKMQQGRAMSNGQLNFIDVLYDKAMRRSNFSHLPSHY